MRWLVKCVDVFAVRQQADGLGGVGGLLFARAQRARGEVAMIEWVKGRRGMSQVAGGLKTKVWASSCHPEFSELLAVSL